MSHCWVGWSQHSHPRGTTGEVVLFLMSPRVSRR